MLKTVLESLDGLDEALKAHYSEKDGQFVLQVEGVDAHPDVANLRNAYERTKADREAARQERDEWKKKAGNIPEDFDPEKWEKLKDGKADEAKLVQLRQDYEAQIEEWKGKAQTAEQRAVQSAIDRDLTDALSAAGVTKPAFAKAARQMLAPLVKMGDDGVPVVETDMGPMAPAEYVKRWAADEGRDFVTMPSGGGATGGNGTGGSKKWSDMNPAEKVALRRENPEEYDRLKQSG
jgi:hypothetical protein